MKLRGALLLVVAATVCALSGLISPQDASASVDAVNQWPAKPTIASNSAASPVTAIYTPGMGTNRLMLVAVATEYSGAGVPAITVTYGGVAQTATQIVANTTQNSKIWLGYFTEAQIAAGSAGTKVLSVTNSVTANLTAMYASVAVYNGVNQTTPTTGSGSNATAGAASLLLSIPLTANAGLAGNAGLSVYVANWNGQTSTPSAGYTEVRDYAGANFNLAYCYKVITGTTTEAPTTTAALAAAGAAAGVSLNPAVRLATIAAGACGDCHGNPPQDGPGTARNTPPGQFIGSHGKHAGKDEGQYGQLCTQCHRNNATISHANGFKNVSGSNVPRSVGGYTGNGAAITNPAVFGTCSNITCHSSGRTVKQLATTPAWDSTTTCLSCHGGRAAGGAASRSANNFSMSTSHSQHLKYLTTEMNCQTCHGKIAASHTALKDYTGAKYHGNGSKNVNFTQIAYGSYTSYKSTASGSSANTKMCTNTACHGGTTRNPWSENGAVNSNHTCTHCHGVPTGVLASNTDRKKYAPGWNGTGTSTDGISVATNVRVGAHFVHLSSIYMKQIKCNECHRVPSTPFGEATHMTGTRYNSQSVTFAQASTAIKNGLLGFTTYTSGTAVKAATCGTTYCHGSKLKSLDTAGTARKPSWNQDLTSNTPSVTVCGRCHGAPPNSVSGSHATATLSGANSCSTCHGSVVNSTGAIINKSLHINGLVESDSHSFPYRGSLHKDLAGATAPASNCACHDYTNAGAYPVARGTAPACRSCHTAGILRTVATVSCYDCHGSGAAATAAWPNGAAFPNNNRSHTKHSTYTAITCDYCHTGGGTGTLAHGNYSGVARVQNDTKIGFSATVNGTVAASWSVAAETCSSTKCHGSAPSPAWGAVSGKTGCAVCHGYRAATWNALDGATATTDHRAGVHFSHISSTTYKYRSRYSCLECHSGSIANSTDLITQANHFNNASSAKVEWGTAPATLIATNYGAYVPTYAPTTKGCSNVWCHGANMNSNVSNPPATRVVTPVWKTPFLTATPSTVGNGVNTPGTGNCSFCHGFPPMTATHAGQGLATCNGCHPHVSTSGLTFLDPSKHVDGSIQASGDCVSCHVGIKGSRAAVVAHFNYSSHHVQGRAVTNADCYQCHAEAADTAGVRSAQHVGTTGASIDLIVWGTGARGTSYISYTANGKREQIAKLNNHCLSCHSTPNASLAPFVAGSTTDKYSPEARLAVPKAKTSISSRYSSTRVVPWSIYNYSAATGNVARFGTNQKNRTTKALSAHGNAAKNQMPSWSATLNGPGEDGNMTDYTYTGNSGKRNVFCYDCHNSHGSDASGITSSYSSLTKKGGLLKSTVAGFGGYDVTYKPGKRTITYRNVSGLGQAAVTTTTAVFNSGAGICNDCHNNDTRKVNISRPWSITGTYSSTRAIVGYWSTPYFDNYTFSSTKRTAYKGQGTGVKARITPMGGHYGSSVSSRSAGHSGEINGLCTPCHDPHGVSNALTTDRDHGVPLLKGTWVTSPYREDKADKLVIRGGGRNVANFGLKGAVPGYHIDQNTFMRTPVPNSGGAGTATSRSNLRRQAFRSFSNNSSAMTGTGYPNIQAATFAGLCLECHNQASLTNTTAPGPGNWKTPARIHQSVAGWAATTGTNSGNKVHAYTCAKCHAPHVSRLPRLLVTNCLDQRHFGQSVATTISSTANVTVNAGNIIQSTLAVTSAYGAGRFPGGGSRYSNTPASAQNPGGWWFQTNGSAGTTQSSGTPDLTGTTNATTFFGSACHNSTNSGGATYSPLNQMWNKKSTW